MKINDSLQLSTLQIGDLATGGSIGAAASTVDIASSFEVAQSTAGQVLFLESPTDNASGREARVANTGTAAFTIFGVLIQPSQCVRFSWHGAWMSSGTASATSLLLPAPKLSIYSDPTNSLLPLCSMADGTVVTWRSHPRITAVNLPDSMIGNAALGLRLELLRYVNPSSYKRRNLQDGSAYRSKAKSGFVHPANHDGVTTPSGSNTGGGVTNNVNVARISEWAVASEGQAFDIDLAAFFKVKPINYTDSNGTLNGVNIAAPTGVASRGGLHSASRPYAAYPRASMPGYFMFRYSVIDPDNPMERVYGATTEVVAASTAANVFREDPVASQTYGVPCATIQPNHDVKRLACWISKKLVT